VTPDFHKNYFELFGLPPGFRIDMALLDGKYRDIQSQVHPDRFAHADEAQKRLSMQWATFANEAYQTLKQPLSRARYLLQMHGVDTAEESNTAMPPAFLMQQMEWREGIMEARAADDIAALEHLAAKLRAERRGLEERLEKLLDGAKDYPAAAETVRMLKFIEKLGEEINLAIEALES
jgi:molecular chaperone HscB